MLNLKNLPLFFALFLSGLLSQSAFAQSPEAFNYQAVVRDVNGNVLPNQAVSFRMNLRATSATGTTVYSETHAATTNDFGLVNLQIGQGTPVSGNFATIDWGNDSHFLEIELDPAGGSNFTTLGTQQLISVPYALHATTVENDAVDDADADPSNELQALSISNDTIFLTSGGFVVLPPGSIDTDDQTLSISNDSLIIQDGNAVDLGAYLDNTDAQVISRSNDTLFLSNGGFAVLPPATADTDDQTLSISNDSLIIQDGNAVDLGAYLDNTDAQVISRSNDTLFLSNGGFAVLPTDQVNDADADPSNELQALSISNDTIFLTSGGFVALPPGSVDTDDQTLSISNDSLMIQNGNAVDLSAYLDNTDAQVISRSNDTLYLSNGGFAVLPTDQVNDADADPSNELQVLTLSNDSLSISGGNTIALSVPAGDALQDADQDTRVEVEQTPDDDRIRFTLAGTERWRMNGRNLAPVNGGNNVAIGENAGQSITTGVANVFLGYFTGNQTETGFDNVGLGSRSLQRNATGFRNTAVGVRALQQDSSGSFNAAFGVEALQNSQSGSSNVAIGFRAGLNNISGNSNVFIGSGAGQNEMGSNRLYIDNSGTSTPLIWGDFANDLLRVNGKLNINSAFSLPQADGNIGEGMFTDGAGNLSWVPLDTSNSNELQTLSLVNDSLSIQNGNGVDLSSYLDNTDAQVISRSNDTLFLSNGGFALLPADQVNDADSDPANEIQNLSSSASGTNRTINISGGTGTTVNVADNDNSSSNELQNLSRSGTNVSLSNGGGTVSIADNDNSSSNELQTLSRGGTTISLSNGGGTVSVRPQLEDDLDLALATIDANLFSGYTTVPTARVPVDANSNYLVFATFRFRINGGSGSDQVGFRIVADAVGSCSDVYSGGLVQLDNYRQHRGDFFLVSFHRYIQSPNSCAADLKLQVDCSNADDDLQVDDLQISAIKVQ